MNNIRSEYQKQWRKEHVDKIKEYNKKYYKNHKEEINELTKKYYSEHKDNILIQMKEWREKNREKTKKQARKRRKNYPNYQKEYNKKHAVRIRKQAKEWRETHPEYKEEYCKNHPEYYLEWRKNHPNYNKEYNKNHPGYFLEWKNKHPEKIRKYNREYEKKKRKNDVRFRLNKATSIAICYSLKGKKAGRHWEDLVGYTLKDLIVHLENLFEPWMNWDNYGKWQIDHKKPKSLFKYKTAEDPEFQKCWALKNLQPMEKMANFEKSDKYSEVYSEIDKN